MLGIPRQLTTDNQRLLGTLVQCSCQSFVLSCQAPWRNCCRAKTTGSDARLFAFQIPYATILHSLIRKQERAYTRTEAHTETKQRLFQLPEQILQRLLKITDLQGRVQHSLVEELLSSTHGAIIHTHTHDQFSDLLRWCRALRIPFATHVLLRTGHCSAVPPP